MILIPDLWQQEPPFACGLICVCCQHVPTIHDLFFLNPVNNMAFEPACKPCQLIMSFLSTDFFSDTWPKWPMCFARKIPQPFSPNFWDPFGVGNGYAVGPEPTEPCGNAWSCGKWQVEQMERGQGHFGGLLSNSRSFVIMVRWYNEAVVFIWEGFWFQSGTSHLILVFQTCRLRTWLSLQALRKGDSLSLKKDKQPWPAN